MAVAASNMGEVTVAKPKWRPLENERNLAWLLLLPTMVLLGLFIAYPFMRGLMLSVTDSRVGVPGNFVGLDNFRKLAADPIFHAVVWNTCLYTLVTTIFKLALGLWLALLLNRSFKFKAFTRAFILLPFIIPTVLSTFAWKWMFDPTFSVLNWMLYQTGMIRSAINWLGDGDLAMLSIIIVNIWRGVPFFAISLLAGLADDQPRPQRGRRDRRRAAMAALLAHHMAAAAAGDHGRRAVLGHPDVRRFPDRLRHDRWRSGQCDASVCDLRLSARRRHWPAEPRCRRVARDVPDPAADRDRSASLHPPRGGPLMIEGEAWRRWVYFRIPLALFLIFLLFPFYWMVITTFRPDGELYRPWRAVNYTPFWTWNPTLTHIKYLFTETMFATWMWNTMFIALASTVISLICGVLAGYALSRLNFPFAGSLGTGIFITYLVPQTLLFIPLSEIIRNYKLGDTPWSLILTYPTFLIPFCTWLMMGYFKAIPKELEECARIDGASRWQAMLYIIIPVAVPGILSAGIFAFTLSWNEFIYALVFLSSPEQKTVPVGVVSELIRGDVFFWGPLMAGALLGSIPVAIAYSFFVEHYVSGLTGSVKG